MRSGELIGQILQSGLARGAGPRMQAGMQSQPGLGGLLGGLLGGGGTGSGGLGGMLGGGHQGSGGSLGGLASMADDYLRGGRGTPGGYAGGMSGGGLGGGLGGMGGLGGGMGGGLGGLIGSMLGGGRTSGAVGGAAMGVIGMIAMNALRNWGQSSSASSAGTSGAAPAGPLTPEEVPAPDERTQQVMLMAMIAAAKSDGHVDDTEMNTIVGKLKEAGADAEASDWVLRELAKPLDVDAVVGAVPNIEVGAQVYAASVLAITPDTPEEKSYLDKLATKLGLQPEVRAYIHQSLGSPMGG
jgi:uncharacterized membrane protein YebE (DUF533 family)